MLKTGSGFKFSKLAKKGIVKSTKQDLTSFLTEETKESFQKLKKAFCEELVLQHFYMSKSISLEINASEKEIREVLFQQDTDMNWDPVTYYLRNMLLV